jgi:pimeloyl-ACP methyl ester carboxylesterase
MKVFLAQENRVINKYIRAIALMGLLAASMCSLANASPDSTQARSQPSLPNSIATQYTHAHDLIDIGDGRHLNIYCTGQGEPTVIFDSGLSDWSSIWALVQPAVSEQTRSCTYDRAGMGYSDSAVRPSTPVAVVEDLHKLIRAAGIRTPVVLVGHSLGGFNVKLYAALYRADVAGLVLVDPSEERTFARTRKRLEKSFSMPVVARMELLSHTELLEAVANYAECTDTARAKDLDPTSPLYARCTDPVRDPLGPEIAAERQVVQVRLAYQAAQASELSSCVYGDPGSDHVYGRLFSGKHPLGNLPLIVLSHSIFDETDLSDKIEFRGWLMLHEQTAALSRAGVHRIVPETHHDIEIDKPSAIIDAVAEVVSKVRMHSQNAARRPAGLH